MPSSVSDRLIAIFARQPVTKQTSNYKPDGTSRRAGKEFTPKLIEELNEHRRQEPLRQLQLLRSARKRIAQGWIAHEIATDEQLNPVEPDAPEACVWCMSGAIQAAAYEGNNPRSAATKRRIDKAAKLILKTNLGRGFAKTDPIISLASLNDEVITSQEEAIEMFDKAIAAQEALCKEKGLL
jgi:hypothetical protein